MIIDIANQLSRMLSPSRDQISRLQIETSNWT